MRYLWLLVILGVIVHGEGKKKKFEGDFEFAEEEDTKSTKKGDKKTWILDPTSDLCQALNCKKREMCLLEDAFTAVCVSKKELHKNGDIIIHKTKLKTTAKEMDDIDVTRDDDDTDDDDDDLYYEDENTNSADAEGSNDSVTSCTPCPVIKPTFLCGTDNRTYSSMCRLDYHNCIHHSLVKISCKGFCPCKEPYLRQTFKSSKDKSASIMNKYKSIRENKTTKPFNKEDKYKFTPEDIKYMNKHYKYLKYTKYNKHPKLSRPDDNDILTNRISVPNTWKKECNSAALETMGNRLLDWFSVVMAEAKKGKTKRRSRKTGVHFPPYCKREVQWMFQHLNIDDDTQLSLQELYDLEHDQNEKCMKPFLDHCDTDRDIFVSPDEWCRCFDKSDRPCAAIKRRIGPGLLGAYVPDCDIDGYYKPTQCHGSVGMCWCVDKHGVEYANTRTRGKPDCVSIIGKADIPDDDDENDIEGSADQAVEF